MNLAPASAYARAFRTGPDVPPVPLEVEIYLSIPGMGSSAHGMRCMVMKTSEAWTLAIVGLLALILALNQLGVDVPAILGTAIQGTAHLLNRPLLGLT
jgi:hypothetical protein